MTEEQSKEYLKSKKIEKFGKWLDTAQLIGKQVDTNSDIRIVNFELLKFLVVFIVHKKKQSGCRGLTQTTHTYN